jgi:hypothetical protein
VTTPQQQIDIFDFECDETDIDFLVSRLLQAKELLSKAIDAKLQSRAQKAE